jgi:hypothetical protein
MSLWVISVCRSCGPGPLLSNGLPTVGCSSNSILRNEDALALPSTISYQMPISISNNTSLSKNQSHCLDLAIRLLIGFMVFVCLILFFVFYRRQRRSRMYLDLIRTISQQKLLPVVGTPASAPVYRKRMSSLPPVAVRREPSNHAESLRSPVMTTISALPPYEDCRQDNGVNVSRL